MTTRRTRIVLVTAWLSLVIADTGRCAVLRGSVRDASTGQPVKLANLRVYPRGRAAAIETAGETDGAFAFENLAAGVYSLCVMGGQEHLPGIVPDIEVHSNVKLDMSPRSDEQSDAWVQGSWLFRAYYELGGAADSFVHFGRTSRLGRSAGDQSRRATSHSVMVTGLAPSEVYRYRVSSHTHKASSHRTFSRIYSFVTWPEGPDSPRFHRPTEPSPAADAGENPVANGGFESGLDGWTSIACAGKKGTEVFRAVVPPMGEAGGGEDGYTAHSGEKLYGFSYIGSDDPTWTGPAEVWNRELITQTIHVTPDCSYVLEAWLLTGDQGSGWGRDARIRLVVDETGGDLLGAFETADQANATQWFATQHRWLPVRLQFTPRAERVVIGAEFLHWWALEASYLYIDDIRVYPLHPDILEGDKP